jgi:hypothetical protein
MNSEKHDDENKAIYPWQEQAESQPASAKRASTYACTGRDADAVNEQIV